MPSVLRRYTPPTCTLEILGKGSVLSRWSDRPLVKQATFRLHFDDPRIPKESRVIITGDRSALDHLCHVVHTYLQGVLEPASSIPLPPQGRLSLLQPAAPQPPLAHPSSALRLEPSGLLNHILHLGPLATEASGPVVRLSVTQLADIAEALDAYQAEAMDLPALDEPSWMSGSRGAWLKGAALLVFALGTTVSVVQYLPGQQVSETQSTPMEEGVALESQDAPRDRPSAATPTDPDPSDPSSSRPSLTEEDATNQRDRPGTSSEPTSRSTPDTPAIQPPADSPERVAPAPSAPQQAPNAPSEPLGGDGTASVESFSAADANQAPRSALPADESVESDRQTRLSAPISPGTAFDRTPQVAEARQYFQSTWSPPEELEEPLEYRLSIDSSGAVQAVTPLGQPSRDYFDQAPIPAPGQVLVSPTDGSSLQIRVLLGPEGTVQTFLE